MDQVEGEGRTDYHARIRLINHDKNKYNTAKYRFVVRFTNKDIIAQITSASIAGDLATGEDFSVEPADSRRPFRALLDVGLVRTTTGNHVFGALKVYLSLSPSIFSLYTSIARIVDKRFAGFSKEQKHLDAEVHRKFIFGGHVAAYMKTLMEDEPEKYQSQFSEYVKKEIEPDAIEGTYKKVHAAIRADPSFVKTEKQPSKTHKRYAIILFLFF
ncbi:60S ribosomal protein L5 [Nymphaea thermarum]|nr:60S ribosomal protein L5 [Nymphaea thermarum]